MKMHHDPTNILPPKAKLVATGAALAVVLVVAPAKARHETAKARHDAMQPTTATR